jgi:hypothetical protein
MNRAIVLLLWACAGGAALAQSEGKNQPAKPETSVPPVTYRSAFEDYRPYRAQEIAPWREVNDEVARVGGHAGVLKATQKPKGTGERR